MNDRNDVPLPSFAQATSFLEQVCYALAFSIEIFLHRGFGSRYMGTQGFIALGIIPLYAFLWVDSGYDPLPLLWFMGVYFVMCVIVRIDCTRRWYRGERTHSRYTGWPRLMRVFPWMSESTVKRYVEPVVATAIGLAILPFNAPLGVYLIIAATALHMMMTEIDRCVRIRVRDMNDAMYEQQELVEQFRIMRGEHLD